MKVAAIQMPTVKDKIQNPSTAWVVGGFCFAQNTHSAYYVIR